MQGLLLQHEPHVTGRHHGSATLPCQMAKAQPLVHSASFTIADRTNLTLYSDGMGDGPVPIKARGSQKKCCVQREFALAKPVRAGRSQYVGGRGKPIQRIPNSPILQMSGQTIPRGTPLLKRIAELILGRANQWCPQCDNLLDTDDVKCERLWCPTQEQPNIQWSSEGLHQPLSKSLLNNSKERRCHRGAWWSELTWKPHGSRG